MLSEIVPLANEKIAWVINLREREEKRNNTHQWGMTKSLLTHIIYPLETKIEIGGMRTLFKFFIAYILVSVF
jgi:hypothetical protein